MLKRKVSSLANICVLLIILLLILCISLSVNKEKAIVQSHKIQLNILLHNLRKECLSKQSEQAANTFLDIRQEWLYLETEMAGGIETFPSDSLIHLECETNKLMSDPGNESVIESVLREINRVNGKLDDLPQ